VHLDCVFAKSLFMWNRSHGRALYWRWPISRDGSFIVTGAQDQSVHIWRTRTGEDLEMSGFPSKLKVLAFRGDGKKLVEGSGA